MTDTTVQLFTSASTFIVDEGDTDVGTATATDLQDVTFTISGSVLAITANGVINIEPADEGSYITDDPSSLEYGGALVEFTAGTATDASSNEATQVITVSIHDSGGIDDNPATGTATGTTTLALDLAQEQEQELVQELELALELHWNWFRNWNWIWHWNRIRNLILFNSQYWKKGYCKKYLPRLKFIRALRSYLINL